MAKTNKEIVAAFIEQILNQKRLDLYETYFNTNLIGHSMPYVGVGIRMDTDSQPGKILIRNVAPGGPADGILQVGDEILSLSDDYRTLNTYEAIKSSTLGPGVIGTMVTCLVRREGQEHNFQIKRGVIPSYETHWGKKDFTNFIKEICPDLCFEIKMMIEEGDIVAYYGVNSGTWMDYGTSVIFGECGMFRVTDGKITETWAVTDDVSMMSQQGYQITPPEKKPVP